MTVNKDITENIPYDISSASTEAFFELTDIAYDLVVDDLPFILKVNNQDPYLRQTAPYKKEQFDNSPEPGEQSLTGWWLRSQTSWHNGAGISFYEPGTDYQHVSHRFKDSRGIDIWTTGEIKLLNSNFTSFTNANGVIATANLDTIVSGDSTGLLKKIVLNSDSVPSTPSNITLHVDHTVGGSTPDLFKAITTDGTRYFAVCKKAIHVGNIVSGTDEVIARHSIGGTHVIKYVKGYLMFAEATKLYYIPMLTSAGAVVSAIGHSGSAETFPTGTVSKQHINPSFEWNVIEGGNRFIYAAGYANSNSEIWAVPFDVDTLIPDPAGAVQVAQLPQGEIVKAMQFYLGYLVIGTNKGIRIAQVAENGSLILGPLLIETDYEVTGFTADNNYIYASTTVMGTSVTNAILIRIDLSSQFDDGTFAYAYDLQYESSTNSTGENVLFAQDRLHIITSTQIQTEKLSQKRSTGWLETGKIRYGIIEPKFFRYINVQCTTGQGDTIGVYTIDENGVENSLSILSAGLSNQDILISTPSTKQEFMSFKFVLNNATEDQNVPKLEAYQIKATPAQRRQRLYQYPLSCFDNEMDKYNSLFGYSGRAMEYIQRMEALEETGKFVNIKDYRTGEQYLGIIEEVMFSNESSPDKDNNGFGGILKITVRKM
jgi:hypothetical protein